MTRNLQSTKRTRARINHILGLSLLYGLNVLSIVLDISKRSSGLEPAGPLLECSYIVTGATLILLGLTYYFLFKFYLCEPWLTCLSILQEMISFLVASRR